MDHDYVLNSMAVELQVIDNMQHPQEKYKKDLLRIGESINTKVTFEQFEKLFYSVTGNYYTPSDKIKIMLIVIYNMF